MQERKPLVLVNGIHAKTGGGRVYLEEAIPRVARIGRGVRYQALVRPTQEARLRDAGVETVTVDPPEGSAGSFLWDQTVLPWIAWRRGAALVFSPANFGPIAMGRRSILLLRNTFVAAESCRTAGARFRWWSMEWMSRVSVKAARGGLVVSESFRRDIAARFGVPEESLAVVHHGRSGIFGPEPREGDGASAGPGPYVLIVADIYPHKNLVAAVEAFARASASRNDIRLVFAGAELKPAYAAEVRARIAGLGIGERVAFLGSRPQAELPGLYRGAVAVLSPSLAETFGITQVEAMACGAPLVASDIPVAREICGDAALLVPPTDVAAMAVALDRVLGDASLRAELSRKGIERSAGFTWDRTAARLHEEVLRRLADLGVATASSG